MASRRASKARSLRQVDGWTGGSLLADQVKCARCARWMDGWVDGCSQARWVGGLERLSTVGGWRMGGSHEEGWVGSKWMPQEQHVMGFWQAANQTTKFWEAANQKIGSLADC